MVEPGPNSHDAGSWGALARRNYLIFEPEGSPGGIDLSQNYAAPSDWLACSGRRSNFDRAECHVF
jgi:hypothetical protein